MWREYITATSIEEATEALAQKGASARVVAGATDLILEIERGVRPGLHTLVDITRIPGLDFIRRDADGQVRIGALATHNQCAASDVVRRFGFPLASAAWQVGAPQIRNRGTVAGNLITASPANDTITPLMALEATLTLVSARGRRQVPLRAFYTGVRKTVMQPDELLTEISFPALRENQRGVFIKLALRRAQAISVVNVAVVLTMEGRRVERAAIALGAVAPTILRAEAAEARLQDQELTDETLAAAAQLATEASRPIDDIRGSAAYRREMVRVCTLRALRLLRDGRECEGFPDAPILLGGAPAPRPASSARHTGREPIRTRINGKEYVFTSGHDKTLLWLLREEAGLTGTKEGCAEGECGACTVWLDGSAVMACLVPAPRAHQAEIVTIEGLARERRLHPVQQAFVDAGAVQCGYCTPGFVMSAARLLEERPHPSRDEIEQALTGNLCRCTGYVRIVQAVEAASQQQP